MFIDFSPNSVACSSASGLLGWAEWNHTHLKHCVVIQTSFKTKVLRVCHPASITGKLLDLDWGGHLTNKSLLSSLSVQRPKNSVHLDEMHTNPRNVKKTFAPI